MADTVQQWAEWTQTASEGLDDARQRVNSVLNDSSATTAEKDKAVQDLLIQEYYVNWLVEQNAEIQQTGVVPSFLSIPSKTIHGALWVDGSDNNKIKSGTLEEFTTNQIINSDRVHVADLDGASIDLWISSNTGNPPTPQIKVVRYDTNGNVMGFICYNTNDTGKITWRFGASNSYYESPNYNSGNRNGYCCWIRSGSNLPPTHANFANMARWSATTSPNLDGEYILSNIQNYVFSGGSVDPNAPWDFYNNDIFPGVDPDNAIIPEPYNPDPEKPEPELPDLPGESENGGDDMERNDITGVGGSFGFLTQYALRGSDVENLGQKLWNGFKSNQSDPDYPDDVTKYLLNFVYSVNPDTGSVNMADIMEFFVSLKMYPFPLGNVHTLSSSDHNLYVGSGTKPIIMNNIIYTMDSYVGKLDCGTLTIPFWFGDYRDYELEIALYLPYCGTVQLNPGDVLGGEMHCEYIIDFCTGSCTAFVDCTTWDNHKITVATLSGQIGADVPMSATNAGRVASRVLNDRVKVAENILSPLKAATTGIGAVMAGNFAGAFRQGFDVFISPGINEQKQLAGMGERGAISAPVLGGGGGFSAFASLPAVFCQVRSPFFTDADNYADAVGLPSSDTVIIGNCTGFCAFHNVDMSSLNADADAVNEIRRLLESGVYI